MTALEIFAAALFFSKFVLAAGAIGLCLVLFGRSRLVGWKLLALAYLEPFIMELGRLIQGKPLLSYRIIGPVVNGATSLNYRLEFPAFYLISVMALLALVMGVRREFK
jgi:hypothetical protein